MDQSVTLEDLEIYQLALQIASKVWCIVASWESFPKRTTGEQLVRACDSIASNIAEGYGRYFYKDRKQFCYYSRGSLMETKTWILKAFERNLISQSEYDDLIDKIKTLHFKLNSYIKKLKDNSTTNN